MNRKQLSLYSLKWNPFSPESPTENFRGTEVTEHFFRRVENLAHGGGFALLTGAPGTGKSVTLRLLESHLKKQPDLKIKILTRPQSHIGDFYRELGECFGAQLSGHNRWAGTKILRTRWQEHIETSLYRSVLIIDEAQEMNIITMNELRLLSTVNLDSRSLLTVILCGDHRLPEKLRHDQLLPLGSRIRVRMNLDPATPEALAEYLQHTMDRAGNAKLMTQGLVQTLCEHAAGNLRILMSMAQELLEAGMQKDASYLDEKLYLEVFSSTPLSQSKQKASKMDRKH